MPLNQLMVDLTWKAKHQQGLERIQECSELWNFARSWIRKFLAARTDNASEKFIYLWVTINAWASMSVPDKTRNHEDAYLVHNIAADQALMIVLHNCLKEMNSGKMLRSCYLLHRYSKCCG